MDHRRVFFGVWVTSLAVLMLELALTRLFSAIMYYHFAFLAISLALFGSGASGIAIYLFQKRIPEERTARWMAGSTSLFAVSIVVALLVALDNPLPLEFEDDTLRRLTAVYTATAVPFFFAGATISLAIFRFARQISVLYLFDLAGAAAGCVLLIPLLDRLGAINTILAIAALAALAALIFGWAGREVAASATAAMLLVTLTALGIYNGKTGRIDLTEAKGSKQEMLLFSRWNSFSRVTVQGDLRQPFVRIKIDSDAATDIYRNASDRRIFRPILNNITALAYHLRTQGKALIIGSGGGGEVVTARVAGIDEITAVEVNPIIADDIMSSEPFREYSGELYQQPGVRLVVDEGRSFVRGSGDFYDVIQASMVDTWAATAAGAFALTENNLYTREAFVDYAQHLTEDGILTFTRWYFEPPDQLLRLVALTRAMMADIDVADPSRHLMLVLATAEARYRVAATLLFKKSPFTDEEVRTVEAHAAARGFHLLYTPLTRPDSPFKELIESPDPEEMWSSYPRNIEPSTDNNPFFFNALRPADLGQLVGGSVEWRKTNLGTVVLFALCAMTVVMVALFMLGPLAVGGRQALRGDGADKMRSIGYFACLGFGFILVEIMLIQKFILFLGHPVYALAVVLLSILAFGGVGSFLSRKISDGRLVPTLRRGLPILALTVALYALALAPIFYGAVHLDRPLRILIAIVLVAPLATLMGMPMPLGIRLLARSNPSIIPWAWGVNGATSVLGSVSALVIALLTGFNQALLIGALTYLAATLLVARTE